jgi:hypothetical protein
VDDRELLKLIDGAFDFLCERRVDELVDVERLLLALDAAATPPRLTRLIERFVAPARTRIIERLEASDRLLGVWLPEPVKSALAQLLGMPIKLPKAWIERAVNDERVRDQVRTTMQEALANAIQKGFQVTPGGRGLKGMIGLAGAAGRGLFGGLATELEDRLRSFVDAGVQNLQQRVAQRLASDETAEQLGRRRRRVFLDALMQPEADAGRVFARGPHAAVDALVPLVIVHNLGRPEIREAIREEVAAAITELSSQTIGELLDELGLRGLMQEATRTRALPLVKAFLASRDRVASTG